MPLVAPWPYGNTGNICALHLAGNMARPEREEVQRRDAAAESAAPRVLVLDDHPAVRSVVGRVLNEHGYEPVNASSVAEATRLLRTSQVAALILDIKLSGEESGLDFLDSLQKEPPLASIPVVVMTGVSLTEEEQEGVRRHGAYLLYKPEGLTALVGFLHKITGADRSPPD